MEARGDARGSGAPAAKRPCCWGRGTNVPHISRQHIDGSGVVNEAIQEIIGNLTWHLSSAADLDVLGAFLQKSLNRRRANKSVKITVAHVLGALLGTEAASHIPLAHVVAARLTGMKRRTASNVAAAVQKEGPRARAGCVGRRRRAEAAGGEGGDRAESLADLPPDLADDLLAEDVAQNCAEEDPNVALGLHVGSLAAYVYTNAHLPLDAFTSFVSLSDRHAPGSVGNVNHSAAFCLNFGRTLGVHLQVCQALEHWQKVPALSIPSDFLRVIDGYTCLGEPCLGLIHRKTNAFGCLVNTIIDISPNAQNSLRAPREGSGKLHNWKSGAAVAEHMVALETSVSVTLADGVLRHAGVQGDGAYVGPWSNNVTKHYESLILRRIPGKLPAELFKALESGAVEWAHACEFHAVQHACDADAMFREARDFDDLLAWFGHRFNFGSSRVVARGVAAHYKVAWRKVLAPRTDNFKATVYASGCGPRFVYLFRTLHGALGVELQAAYNYARNASQANFAKRYARWRNGGEGAPKKEPRPPKPEVGVGLKACREMRSIGRQMLCPRLLVFGLGRSDLRRLFLNRYAALTQNNNISALVLYRDQFQMQRAMQAAIFGIAQLAGCVKMMRIFAFSGLLPHRWKLGRKALRLHIKVFAAHFAHRFIPTVVTALPDMLYGSRKKPGPEDHDDDVTRQADESKDHGGGFFQGVPLLSPNRENHFQEHGGGPHLSLNQRWRDIDDWVVERSPIGIIYFFLDIHIHSK